MHLSVCSDKIPLEMAKSDGKEKSLVIIFYCGGVCEPPAKCQGIEPGGSQGKEWNSSNQEAGGVIITGDKAQEKRDRSS